MALIQLTKYVTVMGMWALTNFQQDAHTRILTHTHKHTYSSTRENPTRVAEMYTIVRASAGAVRVNS